MSKLGLVVVMVLTLGRTNAQNYPAPTSEPLNYFVLIQADDGQSFYVRLDSQLYGSSPKGHLILAPLKDSAYMVTVGFPNFPEQRYLLNIRGKDWALRLSREDNRWGLFDGQGQAIPIAPNSAGNEKPLLAGQKKDDAFSQLMAAIVRDTAVMYNTYAAASTDSAQPPAPAIAPAVYASAALTATAKNESSIVPSSPTGVVKLSEHRSTQSLSLVYTDHPADRNIDTIDVVIPVDSGTTAVRKPDSETADIHKPDPGTASVRKLQPSSDTGRAGAPLVGSTDTAHAIPSFTYAPSTDFYVHTVRIRKATPDSVRSGPIAVSHDSKPGPPAVSHDPKPGPPAMSHGPKSDTPAQAGASHKSGLPFINSDCHAFATDYDVDKLRVRMLNAGKDDDRIQAAYKVFKTKCFSTRQVGALSEVFTTDAAKFKFLRTAYPFVSDDQFPELIHLLTDSVYAGRFRIMTDRH